MILETVVDDVNFPRLFDRVALIDWQLRAKMDVDELLVVLARLGHSQCHGDVEKMVKSDKCFEIVSAIELVRAYGVKALHWSDVNPDDKDLMGLHKDDTGVDFVSADLEIAGQAKNYAPTTRVNADDIKQTLYCSMIAQLTAQKLNRVVFTTPEGVKMGSPKVYTQYPDRLFIPADNVRHWCSEALTIDVTRKVEQITTLPPLRDCQIAGLKAIKEDKVNRLKLACGAGKTRIAIERLMKTNGRRLVFVPSLMLLEQWGDELESAGLAFRKIGTGYDGENVADESSDVIILCVYNSWTKVLLNNLFYELIVVDEAHHIEFATGELYGEIWKRIGDEKDNDENGEDDDDEESDEEQNDDEDEKADKTNEQIRAQQDRCVRTVLLLSASLESEEDAGRPLDYEYTIRQAINDGVVCDYDVTVVYWKEEMTHYKLACWVKYNREYRSILAYCNSVDEAKNFAAQCRAIGISAVALSCEESIEKRTRVIERFEIGDYRVLVSVGVLGEGIDIVCADTTLFVETRRSPISITQCVGRSLRKMVGKKMAHVIVCGVAGIDAGTSAVWRPVSEILRIINGEDGRVLAKEKSSRLRIEVGEEMNEDEIEKVEERGRSDADLARKNNWYVRCEELRMWWEEKKLWPKQSEGTLGWWLNIQRNRHRGQRRPVLTQRQLLALDSIDSSWKDKVYRLTLEQQVELCYDFIKEFDRPPKFTEPRYRGRKIGATYSNLGKLIRGTGRKNARAITEEERAYILSRLPNLDKRKVNKAMSIDEFCILLPAFIKQHARLPKRGDQYQGRGLGNKLKDLKAQYRGKGKGRPLTQDEIAQIRAINPSFPN